jgi:hypothetical protein
MATSMCVCTHTVVGDSVSVSVSELSQECVHTAHSTQTQCVMYRRVEL